MFYSHYWAEQTSEGVVESGREVTLNANTNPDFTGLVDGAKVVVQLRSSLVDGKSKCKWNE